MDDILLTENDLTEIQCVKDYLLQQFHIKDLGDLKYFLGIEFSRSKVGIYMSLVSTRKYFYEDTRQESLFTLRHTLGVHDLHQPT